MDPDRIKLILDVEGMTCQGCTEAVARTIRRLDPQAEVAVDLAQARAVVVTRAQSLDIAQALGKAGFTATAVVTG